MKFDYSVVLFSTAIKLSTRLGDLNTPDLNLTCLCSGKLIKYNQTNRGAHYLCLRCFAKWVKPTRGLLYRLQPTGLKWVGEQHNKN